MERPIEPLWKRAAAVARVIPQATLEVFDNEDELVSLMARSAAEVVFKGAEYMDEPITRLSDMDAQLVPMLEGHSTTRQVQNGIRSRQ